MSQVINEIERVSSELVSKYQGLSAATIHEASGGKGALSSRIKPIFPAMRVCGPAVTVKVRPGDNLLLHKAIYVARPGDVIVADADGFLEAGPGARSWPWQLWPGALPGWSSTGVSGMRKP